MNLLLVSLLTSFILSCGANENHHQYCIVGAGPSGLQIGYFLQRAERDYIIIEKASVAGSFFLHYPRHRKLISINKRHTGTTNKEFNFRHDWNSLISDDESLMVRHYSKDYFPPADSYGLYSGIHQLRVMRLLSLLWLEAHNVMVTYLQDFADKLGLKIHYNSEIVSIARDKDNGDGKGDVFMLKNRNDTLYHCDIMVISTGMWVPNIPEQFSGIEHAEGYESVSIDPADFEGQSVLILGRGNSGFETASNIVGSAAFIHMTSRSRIKLAFQTHYVGDLRAINNELIDTYQLKSLDGLFESELGLDNQAIVKEGDKLLLMLNPQFNDIDQETLNRLPDNLGFRNAYDRIIRCMGFKFDFSIFTNSAQPDPSPVGDYDKYPNIRCNYESSSVQNMFFTGVATHSLDYRKSAGGFIHGFRYTARALFRHMEWRYHGVPWPSVTLTPVDLASHFVKRMNEASGIYQMFGILADVAVIGENDMIEYLEEVPIASLHMLKEMTGHHGNQLIILNMQYGLNYSGPGKDVLSEDRAIGDASSADKSNFLHPVLYYYSEPINDIFLEDIPKTDVYHHVVEDFVTDWTARRAHIIPLRRFIESVFDSDLRHFPTELCFEYALTNGNNLPPCCKQYYSKGGHSVGVSEFTINMPESISIQ